MSAASSTRIRDHAGNIRAWRREHLEGIHGPNDRRWARASSRERRYGILTTLRRDSAPSLPVWYEWDGATLRMFCHEASGKLKRLNRDARATVVVVNHPDDPENWVSFDGRIAIGSEGGLQLAERVFDRYYPAGDGRRSALDYGANGARVAPARTHAGRHPHSRGVVHGKP
jgi:hypothetical protein